MRVEAAQPREEKPPGGSYCGFPIIAGAYEKDGDKPVVIGQGVTVLN